LAKAVAKVVRDTPDILDNQLSNQTLLIVDLIVAFVARDEIKLYILPTENLN
jgi:formaldehyde-activating enzyme involved in methanogenesis